LNVGVNSCLLRYYRFPQAIQWESAFLRRKQAEAHTGLCAA
jgi:hypothetical protein